MGGSARSLILVWRVDPARRVAPLARPGGGRENLRKMRSRRPLPGVYLFPRARRYYLSREELESLQQEPGSVTRISYFPMVLGVFS